MKRGQRTEEEETAGPFIISGRGEGQRGGGGLMSEINFHPWKIAGSVKGGGVEWSTRTSYPMDYVQWSPSPAWAPLLDGSGSYFSGRSGSVIRILPNSFNRPTK
jgi:hypothetical protein